MTEPAARSLEYWAAARGGEPALHEGRSSLTNAEWNDYADLLADAFVGRGLGVDDVIAVRCRNRIEWAVIALACAKIDARLLTLDTDLPASKIRQQLIASRASAVIVGDVAPVRIAAALEHVDGDALLAFEFDEQSLPRRHEIAGRFQDAISLRRRLAVLAPAVHRPAPQPPTLAGQLGERLRDRTRVVERLDHAVEQADLLERVYSGCGDRVAEFVSSRRHLTLEWVIILLLAAEVVLITIDLLANRTP
jgi:hypothetical protein